jgi:monofunctional biosynthetic peptidoglycan transglycosylase
VAVLANARLCFRLAITRGTRLLVLAWLALGALFGVPLLVFRTIDPPGSMLMLSQSLAGEPVRQTFVPLEAVSPHLIRATIASEDGQFCNHRGIDLRELEAAIERAERTGEDTIRGASTITMQVAKNLFLWPGKSYARKALEMGLAIAIELVWPKRRIIEVYLNVAEWGPGIFGAEAAARHHFGKPASRLSPREAALLAVALPNPFERVAGRPGAGTQRLAAQIEARVQSMGQRAACALAATAR